MEDVMVDPLTLSAFGVAAAAVLRLADAGAEWLALRGRTELVRAAAALPPGTRVGGVRRDGTRWLVQVPAAAGRSADEVDR
jgi:hypothetical protein